MSNSVSGGRHDSQLKDNDQAVSHRQIGTLLSSLLGRLPFAEGVITNRKKMRASTSFILTIVLGAVFFYFLNRPYVLGPPCPDRMPEFLERAVTQRMESTGTRFINPDKLAVAFLAQHRFLRDEIQYSPSSRLWGIAFTVGEGHSTSKNTWTAIVGCAGSVELSGWEPKPPQTGWRPPNDWIPPNQR